MGELLERKLDKSFSQMDLDGNGYIEEADLLTLGAKVAAGFGNEPGSERAQQIGANFHKLWKALVESMDADGDARISRREFSDGMTTTFSDRRKYDEFFQPAVDAVLDLCDADGNGTIDPTEWKTIQAAYGTSEADAAETFRLLDADGDGILDRDEIATAAHEFYAGDDPNAPGNMLFGPLR